MEREVDVITLCEKLIEMTNQEKCSWKETSEKSRFKLSLTNGSVEIYHFAPSVMDFKSIEYYDVSLYDGQGIRYATYRATKSENDDFMIFKSLYSSVRILLERFRRRKIALLFDELENSGDKKI